MIYVHRSIARIIKPGFSVHFTMEEQDGPGGFSRTFTVTTRSGQHGIIGQHTYPSLRDAVWHNREIVRRRRHA